MRWAALAAIAIGAMLTCSCRLPMRAPPLTLGAIYPLTGPQSVGGKDEYAGVQTAIRLINASGGVDGQPVQLVTEDAPTPQAGVAAVDVLAQRHVPVILGSYSSVVSVAASAEANRLKTIWWETGAVADEVTARQLPYVFRTVATGSSLGRTSARFTSEVLLPAWHLSAAQARIVIVDEGDVYGRSVAAGATEEASALGLHVFDQITYDAANLDPTTIAGRIAADRPDFLWDASYLGDGVAIWRAIVGSGVEIKGAIGTSSAFCMPEFGKALGPLATGLYASDKPDDTVAPGALNAGAQALLSRAKADFKAHTGRDMSISAVAGFVGAWSLLHDVAPHAHALTAEGIRAAAATVNLPNGAEVNGAGLQFAPPQAADAGQNTRAVGVVGQWQAGQMPVVYPAPFETSKPQIVAVPPVRLAKR